MHLQQMGTMRLLVSVFLILLAACGKSSSPEGRLTLKLEAIQLQLDSLKKENAVILDSLGKLSEEIRTIKRNR